MKLVIRNFQILGRVDIDVEGLTVVVGESRSGKSSFVRAIRALYLAEAGKQWIKAGTTGYSIGLGSSKGVVVRKRSTSRNAYELSTPQGKLVFDKVGREPPNAVQEFLQPVFVKLSDNTLVDVQRQHESFLIDETGSTISECLGEVSGVSKLYNLLSVLANDRTKVARRCEELSRAKEQFRGQSEVRAEVVTSIEQAQQAAALVQQLNEQIQAHLTLLTHTQHLNEKRTSITAFNQAQAELDVKFQQADQFLEAIAALEASGSMFREWLLVRRAMEQLTAEEESAAAALVDAHQAYKDAIVVDGRCVYCGQVVKAGHVEVPT